MEKKMNIKAHREKLGLQQKEIAQMFGVSYNDVSQLERGKRQDLELEKKIFRLKDFVCRFELMRIRAEKGITQNKAAKITGVSESTYFAMENGYRMLRKNVYDRLTLYGEPE